jgi:hypothetical protein
MSHKSFLEARFNLLNLLLVQTLHEGDARDGRHIAELLMPLFYIFQNESRNQVSQNLVNAFTIITIFNSNLLLLFYLV